MVYLIAPLSIILKQFECLIYTCTVSAIEADILSLNLVIVDKKLIYIFHSFIHA